MTQSNKRRPAPQPQRRTAAPVRKPARAHGGVNGDLIKIIALGAVAAVLALLLQCLWPNGFPLHHQDDSRDVAAMVSEIYSAGPLRINEIMTGNRDTIVLEDETSPDWIEIANVSDSEVNLQGCTLSKAADDNRTFTFPDMKIGAGECVLVYADSRLRNDAADTLHAPFRLSSAGDTLMLFNAGGTAVDTVNIAALSPDQSYMRADVYAWQKCDSPTPGLPNTQESYLLLQQPAQNSPVVITEIMSTNTRTLADENGEYYDYIELFNRSGEDVNLNGWYLSDDSANLRKWRMPDVRIGAGQYLVVHASKLDHREDPAHLHTNFGLSSEGEEVLLVSSDGRIMDRVAFDLLKADTAWALNADGSWGVASAASPGRAN